MRKNMSLGVIAMLVALAGCEPTLSLRPLFGLGDRIFEPALQGRWVPERDTQAVAADISLTFARDKENTYQVTFGDESYNSHRLRAQLGRLADFLFLDVWPDNRDTDGLLRIPAHAFFRIRIEPDALELAYLDDEWVKDMVAQGKVQIPHEFLGPDIVLTATTKELQALVLKYAANPDAFSPRRYHRQK
jgi:hypothetical protein